MVNEVELFAVEYRRYWILLSILKVDGLINESKMGS